MTGGSRSPQDHDDLARRKHQAEVEKAEADAAKAQADADKTRADADKAKADAAAAATAADKADADLSNARLTAAATNAKTIAEANSAAETARATAYSKLVPDFGAVKAGSLDVGDGPALWTTELSASAMRYAATAVATELATKVGQGAKPTVLVTTQLDLASADGLNLEVKRSLKELTDAAQDLCARIDAALAPPPQDDVAGGSQMASFAMDPVSALGALAQLVPGLLSLTSANRSVRTGAVAANDLAAVAAVAGQLAATGFTAIHDEFRLIPGAEANGVLAAEAELGAQRLQLVARKIAIGEKLATDDSAAKAAGDALDAAKKALGANKDAAKREPLSHAMDAAAGQVADANSVVARDTSLGSLVEGALSAIDALTADLHSVPAGAPRSKLASAALYESLRSGAQPKIDYVLLVRAEAGQTNQSVSDRALWLKDRVSVWVEASVTYLMISTADSAVAAAGTRTGVAQASGEIGKELAMTVREPRGG